MLIQGRAVIVINHINVSIKKSCDIHIDTEMLFSPIINNVSSKNCCFLPGGLHDGGFKPSFHTLGLYAPYILSCFSDSYVKV